MQSVTVQFYAAWISARLYAGFKDTAVAATLESN